MVPGALSPGIKQPGYEGDHSPPSSAEVKNVWSCTSTPPYVFMVWCLVKYRVCLHGMVLIQAQGTILPLPSAFGVYVAIFRL